MGERIAVVLCTRNGSRWIEDQLRSILTQDRLPNSLHVTDDASDDDTVAIVRRVLADAPFEVDIARNDTQIGIAKNFEHTLQRADAEWLALCDQDDVWGREKLARVERAYISDPAVTAVFSDGDLVDATGAPITRSLWAATGVGPLTRRRLSDGQVLEQLLRWNVITGATLVVRRDVLDVALPVPPDTLHDEWLALIGAGLGKVVALPEKLVAHRIHGDAAVGVPSRRPRSLLQIKRDDAGVREHEAARFAEAARRLRSAGRADSAAAAEAKAEFARHRSDHVAGLRRLLAVAGGLVTGRYHRLAHGLRSAAHDLAFGP